MHVCHQLNDEHLSPGEDGCPGGSGQEAGLAGGSGLREAGEGQSLDSAAAAEGWSIVLKRGMRATVHHADSRSPRVCLAGAGEAVRPGKEVPCLDGREELFEKHWRRQWWWWRGGGERRHEDL